MAENDPAAFFDGTSAQPDLVGTSILQQRSTFICLISEARDGFVVVSGSDLGMDSRFSDADILNIFSKFAEVVDTNLGADAATIRMEVAGALIGLWHPSAYVGSSPFDEKISAKSRIIYHVYSQGWGFEPARIKFKEPVPAGGFTGLSWLTLNGISAAPFSFQLDVNAEAVRETGYEFALYIQASQDAGNQTTRLIIDPKIQVDPPPV